MKPQGAQAGSTDDTAFESWFSRHRSHRWEARRRTLRAWRNARSLALPHRGRWQDTSPPVPPAHPQV